MVTTPTPKATEEKMNSLQIRVLARNASTTVTNNKMRIKTPNQAQKANTYGSDEEDEGSNSVGRGRGRSPVQPSQKAINH